MYGVHRFFVLATAIGIALASSGDRSEEFRACVDVCAANRCQLPTPVVLPLALRLTHWTCNDNCRYLCMHEITIQDIDRGVPVQQYNGKWPFWRFGGMQEPASVAFSLLNLWAHAQGALKVKRRIPQTHPMRSYYLVWSFTSINTWIWSSVFHTRDLPITEKLDYFSAALAILYALYYTVIRLFHLYPRQSRLTLTGASRPTSSRLKLWSLLVLIAYVAHVSYLTLLPRFDYTYNMAFNLVIGLTHNLLWLLYSLPTGLVHRFPSKPKSYRPSYVGKAAVFVILTTAATALELFDFPPWGGVIDAHALWHLSTAPIALFWYDFLVDDALDGSWREQKA